MPLYGRRPACRRGGGRLALRNPRFMAGEKVDCEQGALHEPAFPSSSYSYS